MAREIGATIREFQRADLPALKALVHKTIATCYPGHYGMEAVRFFLDYHNEEAILQDAQKGRTVILDKAGRILGTGTLVEDEIKRVFVDPTFQKQGFGRSIMQQLEEAATWQGTVIVKLDASLPSKAFYDRLGYITLGPAFLPVGNDRRLDFFKMQKTL
ncbi:MAG: GNAT family N-acetyltransferase [Planctomycetes bacterium]|nr:GNAT family N-acetyltransferase [Planctomycetota bacterium]